jgi:acyl-CoA carboxylase subunit beta
MVRLVGVLGTRVDRRSEVFAANQASMLGQLAVLGALHAEVLGGGGPKYVERHRERGKLTARERVDLLLDPGSPFLELSALSGWAQEGEPIGSALCVGIGVVHGVDVMVCANDPTVRGGSFGPMAVVKQLRAHDIALTNRLPTVHLVESGGAELPKQRDVFVPGGRQFANLTKLSAAGIPTISLVFGSSTAGGAYVPGMSDHTVFVRGGAKVFLGGPPLVKMAIDEEVDDETLGGAEMHASVSGLADHLAADEHDAMRIGRDIVRNLHWRKAGPGRDASLDALPVYDVEELLGIAPSDVRVPFEMREVIARIVDASRLDEFKPRYGDKLVCGYASIHGFPIGVLANNGILFSEEAQKGAQFIQHCNRSATPILFVQNITGFMVGSRYERGGIIKHGSQLINAVTNSGVPHLTLMVGASYGAGNYAMAGRAYDPRFVFSWPSHRIAVMGPKQLAGVMNIVTKGRDPDGVAALEAQVEEESTALFATSRMWDDGVIDPRLSRTTLGLALSAVHSAPVRGTTEWGTWRL